MIKGRAKAADARTNDLKDMQHSHRFLPVLLQRTDTDLSGGSYVGMEDLGDEVACRASSRGGRRISVARNQQPFPRSLLGDGCSHFGGEIG